MILRKRLIPVACLSVAVLMGCSPGEDPPTDPDAAIRMEVEAMADDFVNLRMLTGFVHEMPLDEAYRWQDAMVEILPMGEVVGYKTGGHDPNPPNPNFPPGGIRAHLLAGMFRDDGDAIRVDETAAGFLEADFAFRVGDASINTAGTDLEILAGLDAVVPFAEIPDPWYDPETATVNRMIVSNMISRWAFAGEAVPIEPTEEWLTRLRSFDYAVLDENDAVIQEGSMAEWYDPIAAVRWLRDQLRDSGKQLAPRAPPFPGERRHHAPDPRGIAARTRLREQPVPAGVLRPDGRRRTGHGHDQHRALTAPPAVPDRGSMRTAARMPLAATAITTNSAPKPQAPWVPAMTGRLEAITEKDTT